MSDLPPSLITWFRMSRFVHNSDLISNASLQRHGLSIAQFEVLDRIRAFEPVTQTELADHLTLSCGGVSRMLTRLEADGLIVREQEWKTKHISLTPAGRALFDQAYPEQVRLQASLFDDCLSEAEQAQLGTLVKKLYDHSKQARASAE